MNVAFGADGMMKIAWSEELTLSTATSGFLLFGLLKGRSLSNAPVNLSFMFSLVLRCSASSLYAGCVGCARERFISVPHDWNMGRSALGAQGLPPCTDRETEMEKLLLLLLDLGLPVSMSRDLSVPPHSSGTCHVSLQFSPFRRRF